MRHVVVVRLAVYVEELPVYFSLSPPTVTRTLCFTCLCGQRLATMCGYMTFLPGGTAEQNERNSVCTLDSSAYPLCQLTEVVG